MLARVCPAAKLMALAVGEATKSPGEKIQVAGPVGWVTVRLTATARAVAGTPQAPARATVRRTSLGERRPLARLAGVEPPAGRHGEEVEAWRKPRV